MKTPTSWQYSMAALFNIPRSQAGTITIEKVREYYKAKNTDKVKLERFLDELYLKGLLSNQG